MAGPSVVPRDSEDEEEEFVLALEVVKEIQELKTLVVEGMEALQEMMEFQEKEYERLRERFEEEIDEGYFQVEEDGSESVRHGVRGRVRRLGAVDGR